MQIKCTPIKKIFPPEKADELDFSIVQYQYISGDMPESGKKFVAIGPLLPYSDGAEVSLVGEWTSKKGKAQLEVASYDVLIPLNVTSVMSFLGCIEGCSEKTATRLYNNYGVSCIDMLDEDLGIVDKIVPSKMERELFKTSWVLHRRGLGSYLYLRKMKVNSEDARNVAAAARDLKEICDNPFPFCIKSSLPYMAAKKIAKANGVDVLCDDGICASMVDVLRQNEGSSSSFNSEAEVTGNTYLAYNELMRRTANAVGILSDDSRIKKAFTNLVMRGIISVDEGKYVSRTVTCNAETQIAREVHRLLAADVVKRDYKLDIYKLEDQKKMRLAPEQRNAVKVLLSNAVSLLIGGPGCGKTTIEQFIIEVFKMYHPNDNVLLLAPTGKAARRMSESTGYPACTIHKGLGVSAGTEVLETDTILDASLILVDEASMVDTQVGAALFKAVRSGAQIALVGDTDQLPSVGAGNVLFELIASDVIPIARLETVYRQKAGSTIAVNCARIRQGFHDLEYDEGVFTFIPAEDDETGAQFAIDEFMKAYNKGLKLDDICLLSPYRRSTATGVNALNERLQKILIKKGTESITYGSTKTFYLGDKVMSMTNDDKVSNGDTGYITEIRGSKFVVNYGDGRVIEYQKSAMRDFELAYGISIHKSQGQEFKLCIILMCDSHVRMLKRNLLYTAVSRAKQEVIIIGSKAAMDTCIATEDVTVRKTLLSNRLRALCSAA